MTTRLKEVSQKLRKSDQKVVHASYVSSIYEILGLYKIKKATKRCNDVLLFCCPGICS